MWQSDNRQFLVHTTSSEKNLHVTNLLNPSTYQYAEGLSRSVDLYYKGHTHHSAWVGYHRYEFLTIAMQEQVLMHCNNSAYDMIGIYPSVLKHCCYRWWFTQRSPWINNYKSYNNFLMKMKTWRVHVLVDMEIGLQRCWNSFSSGWRYRPIRCSTFTVLSQHMEPQTDAHGMKQANRH
jgi:hypothetical protein